MRTHLQAVQGRAASPVPVWLAATVALAAVAVLGATAICADGAERPGG